MFIIHDTCLDLEIWKNGLYTREDTNSNMNSIKPIIITLLLLSSASYAMSTQKVKHEDNLKTTLSKMSEATNKLTSFEAEITYKIIQDPELFESTTANKGKIWYFKDATHSYTRLSFTSRQEDDFDPEKYHEEYIFDGYSVTRINYQLKQISTDQLAKKGDKPIDALELLSENMPIIGFTSNDDLNKDFVIKLLPTQKTKPIELNLVVKENSKYYDKYVRLQLYIDRKLYLPIQIIATTRENDTYDIKLNFKRNALDKPINLDIFKVEQPSSFEKIKKTLQKTNEHGKD